MDRDTKQESSIPVQSRVSIVTLATLDNYWTNEGRDIRTVSQLVSWSLYLLSEILTTNNMLGTEPSIEEARNHMMNRGLYQRNMDTKGYQKLGNAIRFQGMREEGNSPQQSLNPTDRTAYSLMHRAPNKFNGKPSSVEPFTGRVGSPYVTQEMIDKYNNMKSEDVKPIISREFAMRDVELEPLKQGTTNEDISDRIQENDKIANAQLDELNSFDPMSLIGKAIKKE
jgi:hypothetical protein